MDRVNTSILTFPHQIADSGSETSETPSLIAKKYMLPWKIVCLVLALLVSLGWVGIIALLIMKEEWQLVLVAWLLLYAAVHFCYWYCRRNSTRAISTQIRQRVVARLRGTEVSEACDGDCPPSYDDLVKSEVPPPAYYSVVDESPKMGRLFRGLPWFLKKKALEQEAHRKVSSPDVTIVIDGNASTSIAEEQSSTSDSAWKSSVSSATVVTLDDEEEAFELPSYDVLMRENVQPVLTPIHMALAGLPSTQPPPPYSPRPLDSITEQNE